MTPSLVCQRLQILGLYLTIEKKEDIALDLASFLVSLIVRQFVNSAELNLCSGSVKACFVSVANCCNVSCVVSCLAPTEIKYCTWFVSERINP